MRILLSNDDGIDAPGLRALEAGLATVAEVTTVAPDSERSAQSHALTMHAPLRALRAGERRWAVSGTPADCVYLALHSLLSEPPHLVFSGINSGANLGNDIHYSGTVAAAREACLHGHPAVSVSLHRTQWRADPFWETAVQVALRVLAEVTRSPPPAGVHLNVNVPDIPPGELRGIRTCVLGRRNYTSRVDARRDPRGRRYFWIGGDHMDFERRDDADGHVVEAGWASITPLTAFPTHPDTLAELRRWTDG